MTEHFMSEENFKSGVRQYLKDFQYQNAETKDLWESINDFANETVMGNLTVESVMNTWTKKAGYPVVFYNGSKLTQERFLLNATGKIEQYLMELGPELKKFPRIPQPTRIEILASIGGADSFVR